MFDKFRITVSAERANVVIREISIGSEPKLHFYLMVAASGILASFRLVQNSTAVVIGAILANTDLSLALGFDHWAIGSFLLFF